MGTRHILLIWERSHVSAPIFGGFFARKTLLLFLIFFLSRRSSGGRTLRLRCFPTGGGRLPANPIQSLKTLYGYAFQFPVDEETYFYEESDYYTIKLKRRMTTEDRWKRWCSITSSIPIQT
jgi:hypothetical protein